MTGLLLRYSGFLGFSCTIFLDLFTRFCTCRLYSKIFSLSFCKFGGRESSSLQCPAAPGQEGGGREERRPSDRPKVLRAVSGAGEGRAHLQLLDLVQQTLQRHPLVTRILLADGVLQALQVGLCGLSLLEKLQGGREKKATFKS